MPTRKESTGNRKGAATPFPKGTASSQTAICPRVLAIGPWADIQKYVMVLARGGNMLGTKPGIFVTNCTDGFRPVFFLLERIEE